MFLEANLKNLVVSSVHTSVHPYILKRSLPGGQTLKNLPAMREARVHIPGSGRLPGEANGNPLQDSCLEISWTEESGELQSMASQRLEHN